MRFKTERRSSVRPGLLLGTNNFHGGGVLITNTPDYAYGYPYEDTGVTHLSQTSDLSETEQKLAILSDLSGCLT